MKKISTLPEMDQQELMAKYKGAVLTKTKEHNDLLLLLLKAHCEAKQMTHEHDYDTAENRYFHHYWIYDNCNRWFSVRWF